MCSHLCGEEEHRLNALLNGLVNLIVIVITNKILFFASMWLNIYSLDSKYYVYSSTFVSCFVIQTVLIRNSPVPLTRNVFLHIYRQYKI